SARRRRAIVQRSAGAASRGLNAAIDVVVIALDIALQISTVISPLLIFWQLDLLLRSVVVLALADGFLDCRLDVLVIGKLGTYVILVADHSAAAARMPGDQAVPIHREYFFQAVLEVR